MPELALSKHALEQLELRSLTIDMVETVLRNPDRITNEEDNQRVYQAIIQRGERDYLLRVFVNSDKTPNLVKTVYLTSKISKYQ